VRRPRSHSGVGTSEVDCGLALGTWFLLNVWPSTADQRRAVSTRKKRRSFKAV
jgi:hypothetical protein